MKSGFPAWGAVGDPNAASLVCQPQVIGPQFGALAAAELSLAFVSAASIETGGADELGTHKQRVAVRGCRGIGPADMVRNNRLGAVRVDPATHVVTLDGEAVAAPPADHVVLSRRYFL